MTGSILVVDDEKGQREILNTILQKEGYRIVDVAGAREALERLDTGRIRPDPDRPEDAGDVRDGAPGKSACR